MIAARTRILLIACIALLQCLVPLIHAHAHEVDHGPQHVHLHLFDLDAGAQAPHTASESKVSASLPGTVSVVGECKHELPFEPVLVASAMAFPALAHEGLRPVFPPTRHTPARGRFHSRPPATAPPRLAAQRI